MKTPLENAIDKGRRIVIITFSLQPRTEEIIRSVLYLILKHYNKEYLNDSLSSVLFETIMNCIKANAKRIFFEENHYDIKNQEDYKVGLINFKQEIGNRKLRTLCEKGRKNKHHIKIIYTHSRIGLKIEIINNTEILEEEEKRIREKLSKGQQYENLYEFYDDNSDTTEGEGLGLVLSLLMLKSEGIDPSDFRIGSKNGITRTRIEIPFEKEYISERALYKLEHNKQGLNV